MIGSGGTATREGAEGVEAAHMASAFVPPPGPPIDTTELEVEL